MVLGIRYSGINTYKPEKTRKITMPNVRKIIKNPNTGVIGFKNDTTSTIPGALLTANQIAAEYQTTKAPTLGVSTAYGTALNATPDAGFTQIEPTQIVATWGGTFATETANLKIVATFSDATTATVTGAGVTSTGVVTYNTNDLAAILTTGKKITNLAVSARTTKAVSTLVTLSVVITGIENQ